MLALDNVFSTKSEEQEVNLVWPNLFIQLMIMISSELCLNEYQWISKLSTSLEALESLSVPELDIFKL